MYKGLVVVGLVLAGCSTHAKCVSLYSKLGDRMESCGIAAAEPASEVEKTCTDEKMFLTIGKERAEYLLGASTCDALRLRVQESARRDLDKAVKDSKDQLATDLEKQRQQFKDAQKANDEAFKEAFKAAVEKTNK